MLCRTFQFNNKMLCTHVRGKTTTSDLYYTRMINLMYQRFRGETTRVTFLRFRKPGKIKRTNDPKTFQRCVIIQRMYTRQKKKSKYDLCHEAILYRFGDSRLFLDRRLVGEKKCVFGSRTSNVASSAIIRLRNNTLIVGNIRRDCTHTLR